MEEVITPSRPRCFCPLTKFCQANKYEQLLARRVDGISHNLHRALHRHSRISQEDVTLALVEHARSTVMYEKQLLRELESLRPDFNNAARKAPAATSRVAPPAVRPTTPPGVQPTAPQTTPSGAKQSSTPTIPRPLDTSSPSAGPPIPRPPLSPERIDGTKSMFITPSSDPLLSPSQTRTLGRSTTTASLANGGDTNGQNGYNHPLAASVRVEPSPRRLDAREAAAKLANFL